MTYDKPIKSGLCKDYPYHIYQFKDHNEPIRSRRSSYVITIGVPIGHPCWARPPHKMNLCPFTSLPYPRPVTANIVSADTYSYLHCVLDPQVSLAETSQYVNHFATHLKALSEDLALKKLRDKHRKAIYQKPFRYLKSMTPTSIPFFEKYFIFLLEASDPSEMESELDRIRQLLDDIAAELACEEFFSEIYRSKYSG